MTLHQAVRSRTSKKRHLRSRSAHSSRPNERAFAATRWTTRRRRGGIRRLSRAWFWIANRGREPKHPDYQRARRVLVYDLAVLQADHVSAVTSDTPGSRAVQDAAAYQAVVQGLATGALVFSL